MTITSTEPTSRHTADRPTRHPFAEHHEPLRPGERIVVHGDFNCPWSYLAYRRAAALVGSLGAEGTLDWRAVEHAPWTPGVREDRRQRYEAMADQARLATALLAPGEELPFTPAGFMPRTRATVAAYAEAYASGIAGRALRLLFDSYWQDGDDVGDPVRLREMLRDELRGGDSASAVVREWGYPVDVTGGPISGHSWELVRTWQRQWEQAGHQALPLVRVGNRPPMTGTRGVDWLGREMRTRGLGSDLPPLAWPTAPAGLPSLSWTSGSGGAWLERSQRLAAAQARSTR